MIRTRQARNEQKGRWPRTSGDDPNDNDGNQLCLLVGPARAGMIRNATDNQYETIGWPRTSGDDPQQSLQPISQTALAPHERG